MGWGRGHQGLAGGHSQQQPPDAHPKHLPLKGPNSEVGGEGALTAKVGAWLNQGRDKGRCARLCVCAYVCVTTTNITSTHIHAWP